MRAFAKRCGRLVAVGLVIGAVGMAALPVLDAQEADDIREFLQRGQACYLKRDLSGAALEFENVLLLEPENFEALIWLAQIYADQKNMFKARQMLSQAKKIMPSHARVVALDKLFGPDKPRVTKKETDLVMHEALTLLGSGTRLRPFGLVVPEQKVRAPGVPSATVAAFEDVEVAIEPALGGGQASLAAGLDAFAKEEGPLAAVFEARSVAGLAKALDTYFELAGRDRTVVEQDDRGLLKEGLEFYEPKCRANASDTEAVYYYGMIQFYNGSVDEAFKLLEPLRETETPFGERLQVVWNEIDKRRQEEEARREAIKRAEEAREAARQAAAAEAAAASAAIVAASANAPAGTVASAASPADAVHAEGYELYKKGQVDAAIEKFNTAISRNPDEPMYHYHLGLAMTDKGLGGQYDAFDRAIESFNKVLQLAPPGEKLAKDAEAMIRDITAAKSTLKR
ncbi:MAG TPA: tetratricopeptide repeat protein [Candidatus Ozemobacteraceae bacterium]|nr:tetratricopeptide repeat protein [Candidatus Ozemobacteraceae bacterium]